MNSFFTDPSLNELLMSSMRQGIPNLDFLFQEFDKMDIEKIRSLVVEKGISFELTDKKDELLYYLIREIKCVAVQEYDSIY